MQELLERLLDEVRSAWRFRWIGLAVAVVVAVLGWVVVFALPDRYEAYASVFVDSRTALRPGLQGLTVEQDINVQLNYVRQSLLSGEQLQKIARDSGVLPAGESDPRKVASILDGFAKHVVLNVRSAGNQQNNERDAGSVYSFDYEGKSRAEALKVIQTVQEAFIEQTLGGKRAGTQSAQEFMKAQIDESAQQQRDSDNRLAEFKRAHIGLMPTEQGGYVAQLNSEIDLTKKLENDLNVAQLKRAELGRQLRGESVIGATAANPTGPGAAVGGDTMSRINETQAKLDELLLRFTEKYPDVIALRSTLAELKARRAAEIEKLKTGDASAAASSGISSNPVYQSILLQMNQSDLEITSLKGQVAQHREKVADLRKHLDEAPKVEAQLGDLIRDSDAKKAQYTGLLANYQKMELGERADDAGSVRFETVQPPTAPFSPASPKRFLLLFGVLVTALGIGGALTYLLHVLSPVVGSMNGLAELTGLTVLGMVSPAFPKEQSVRRRGEMLRFIGAGGVLFVAFVCTVLLNRSGFRVPFGAG